MQTIKGTMLIEHHGQGFTNNENAVLLVTGMRFHLIGLPF